MGSMKRFREKTLRGLGIAGGTQPELQGTALRVYRSVEVHPDPFDLHICLIHAPRIIGALEMRPAALRQLRGVVLHPTIDRGVVHQESSLCHHFFQISVTKRITRIPADTQQNNLSFEETPFE